MVQAFGFRSALPRGERRLYARCRIRSGAFRSALPRGERPAPGFTQFIVTDVSIRAPARGATIRNLPGGDEIDGFDPRSRAGSDHGVAIRFNARTLFRSALPRGERQQYPGFDYDPWTVSIRAPARGATWAIRDFLSPEGVSIRAPARGATAGVDVLRYHQRGFRSALPRGERRPRAHRAARCTRFDPRSRAGSDGWPRCRPSSRACFDPRSRAGSDQVVIGDASAANRFRSALPRGERREAPHGRPQRCRFDPRSRAGSDYALSPDGTSDIVSIRAPARGATRRVFHGECRCDVSIRAPARGATRSCRHLCGSDRVSIRAPARGAT